MPFFISKAGDTPVGELPNLDGDWVAFIDNAPSMIWISDLQGRLLHVNETWRRATGVDVEGYQSATVWDLVHPDDRERLAAAAATFNDQPVTLEFRLRQADGRHRWVQENVRPWRAADGRRLGYIGSSLDIQGQKDQEQYLAVLAMRQTSLTYFSRLVVEMSSAEQVNDEALRLFCEHLCLPAAALLLQTVENGPLAVAATSGLEPDSFPIELTEVAPSGVTLDYPEDADTFPISHEWMSRHDWSEGVAVPLDPAAPELGWIIGLRSEPSGAPIGPLHYARDLVGLLAIALARRRAQSKLREGEERALQLQKMEAVGLLAGGVAHDFNNLLTAVRCFAELLRDDLHEPEQQARVDDILHAASRASHLVRQLVAFSRQEISNPEPIDLNGLVDSLRGFIRSVLSEHVRIDVDLSPQPAWCRVDSKQLEQVIFNLCLNARDVMPVDGVLTLRVNHTQVLIDGRRRVRLSVSDTGSGIPPEVRAKLFKPFHSTKARGRGTGLGLATSLGIVRSFGGDLTYETEMGCGTVFHIDLPEIDDPLASIDEPGEASHHTEQLRARILLVEDDDLVRSVTFMLAQSLGHTVTTFGDSLEAFNWATQTRLADIDLLVTDIVMPGLNGHELSRRLRVIRPDLRVFYMSGYVDDETTLGAMAQPGVFFLSKPFSSEDFANKLSAALQAPH